MNRNQACKEIFRSSLSDRVHVELLLLASFVFLSLPVQNRESISPVRRPGPVVRRLNFIIKTGNDDLRGGNDNLNVAINFRDGNVQLKPNVNAGQRWPDDTTQEFTIGLERPRALSEIASIEFQKPTGGGYGTDEWHMISVSVRAIGDDVDEIIATHGFTIFDSGNQSLLIPVTVAVAGKANSLQLTIKTGGDDLRGGANNVDVIVTFRGGATQTVTNVNGGQGWGNNTTHTKNITLDHAVQPADIVRIELRLANFMLSSQADNWDMDSISVKALGDGVDKIIARHGFFRFTQKQFSLSMPITLAEPGKATRLELTIQTGGDDLRGENDNLNVVIHFGDGDSQVVRNVNGGRAWGNNSNHVETITLSHAVAPSDILEVELQTTFTGGTGGDNWDMDSVVAKAVGDGVNEVLFRHGFKRFTGDNKTLRLRRD